MKKKRNRTPAHRVNRRQKALAIRTLERALVDPATPPHAAVTAARTLLNDGREVASDPTFERDPDAPRKYVILPDNARDPNVRYGVYDDEQRVIIVPNGYPYEVHPESFYAGVAKAAPDPRFSRNRAETLSLPLPSEDEAA